MFGIYILYYICIIFKTLLIMALSIFTIEHTTKFGLGIFKIKAESFEDAFNRISKKDKFRATDILDEDMNSISSELFESLKSKLN